MGVGFQGRKREMGLPGQQGPPDPFVYSPGPATPFSTWGGPPLLGKGITIIGPSGDRGQPGEKVR